MGQGRPDSIFSQLQGAPTFVVPTTDSSQENGILCHLKVNCKPGRTLSTLLESLGLSPFASVEQHVERTPAAVMQSG
jgi:hypothetical protein